MTTTLPERTIQVPLVVGGLYPYDTSLTWPLYDFGANSYSFSATSAQRYRFQFDVPFGVPVRIRSWIYYSKGGGTPSLTRPGSETILATATTGLIRNLSFSTDGKASTYVLNVDDVPLTTGDTFQVVIAAAPVAAISVVGPDGNTEATAAELSISSRAPVSGMLSVLYNRGVRADSKTNTMVYLRGAETAGLGIGDEYISNNPVDIYHFHLDARARVTISHGDDSIIGLHATSGFMQFVGWIGVNSSVPVMLTDGDYYIHVFNKYIGSAPVGQNPVIVNPAKEFYQPYSFKLTVVGGGNNELSATLLGVGRTDLLAGESTYVDFRVAVAGQGVAPDYGLYLSADPTIDSDDRLVGSGAFLTALPDNGAQTLRATATIPADVAPGTYYLGAIVNPRGTDPYEVTKTDNITLGQPVTIAGAVGSSLAISADKSSRAEGDLAATNFGFTIARTGDLAGAVTAAWTVAGTGTTPASATDFIGAAFPVGTLTFADGQASQTVQVQVAGDTAQEADEGFSVTLSAVVGAALATATASATILNDDTPAPASTVAIAPLAAVRDEGQSGVTAFTFTVARSGSTTGTGSVAWSVAGAGADPAIAGDFAGGTLPAGTVGFAPGEASRTITVDVAGDGTVEPDESFAVTLSDPSAGLSLGAATAAGTIGNDDASLAIAAVAAGNPEGNSGATAFTFTITRSGSTAGAGTVAWSVAGSGATPAAATDFAGGALPAGTASFAAGQASQTITVMVAADPAVEPDESFTVKLASPSAGFAIGVAEATGTILNDDEGTPTMSTSFSIAAINATRREGNAGTTPFTFTIARSGDTAAQQSLSWKVDGADGGQATLAGNPVIDRATVDAASGIMFFDRNAGPKTPGIASGWSIFAEQAGGQVMLLLYTDLGDTWQFAGASALETVGKVGINEFRLPGGLAVGPDTVVAMWYPPGTVSTVSWDPSGTTINNGGWNSNPITAERLASLYKGEIPDLQVTPSFDGSGWDANARTYSVRLYADLPDADDFAGSVPPSGSVTFAAGETTRTITVGVAGDVAIEADERFAVTLFDAPAGTTLGTASAAGTIRDDDSTLLTNGGFETGDFTGWTLNFTPPDNVAKIIDANATLHTTLATWDLKADWSNSANPNGPWSYGGSGGTIPVYHTNYYSSVFGNGQGAWASMAELPGATPSWMKLTGAGNTLTYINAAVGDIISAPAGEAKYGGSLAGDAPASVVKWTSPGSYNINISGSTWHAHINGQYTQNWDLALNGMSLQSGALPDWKSNGKDNPDQLQVTNLAVKAGDVVSMSFTPDTLANFVGLSMTIDAVASRVNEGRYSVNFSYADVPATAVLTQSFLTMPGQTYRVAYDFGTIGQVDRSASLLATVLGSDGAIELGKYASSKQNSGDEPNPPTWRRDAFTFTADGPTATLRFTDTTNPSIASDALLDHVVVEPVNTTTLTLAAGSDTGASASDGVTSVAAPSFVGTAAPNATVALLDGTAEIGTGKADAAGLWSIALGPLADSAYSITASATDAGGLVVNSAPFSLVVDTVAPGAPSGLALYVGSDSGELGDSITENVTQVINGSAEAGATVTLFAGADALGTTVADGTGAWSFAAGLKVGVHSLTARAADLAGNAGPKSAPLSLTVIGALNVSIAALDADRAEGHGGTTGFTFTLTRSGDLSGKASVDWATTGSGANAAAAADFAGGALPSGTLAFAAGQASRTITLAIAGDNAVESDESFTVTLTNPSAGLTIGPATATGTIQNDDAGTKAGSFGTSTYLAVATTDNITWAEAEAAAEAQGGHLAAIGSSAENDYVFALANDPLYWSPNGVLGPWLGGYQPAASAEPAGGWAWVTGEAFAYTRWAGSQPDNTGGAENRIHYFLSETGVPTWNDVNVLGDTNFGVPIRGYVVEFDGLPLSYPGYVPPPTLTIAALSASQPEGHSGTTVYTFTVARSGDTSGSASAKWAVSGSAANPAAAADFAGGVLPSGSVGFAAGEASRVITVNVAGDSTVEPGEDFTVTLSDASAGLGIAMATAAGVIQNDDAALSVVATSAAKPEGNSGTTGFTFTVSRTGSTTGASSAKWSVAGSGANPAAAADFAGGVLPTGSVTFTAGQTSRVITVNVAGDSTVEPNEGFTLTLASPSAGTSLVTATAGGTIQNDDAASAATLAIAPLDAERAEGSGGGTTGFTFTVTRAGSSAGAIGVDWSVGGIDGAGFDPTGDADFAATSGTLSFADGQTSRTLTIAVRADTLAETDEAFVVVLANPTGSATIDTAAAIGVIDDDDSTISVAVASGAKPEGSGATSPFTFTILRSGNLPAGQGVSWKAAGVAGLGTVPANAADFAGGVFPGGSVTFAAGESSRTVTINVAADTKVELNERFVVLLSAPTGGATLGTAAAATVIYNDDFAPKLSITGAASSQPEGNGGTTAYTFTVTRSGDTGGSNSASWAVSGVSDAGVTPAAGSDFAGGTFPSGVVSFAAGETSRTITVAVQGDAVVEANERFAVTLSAPTGGATLETATALGTIANDDTVGTGTLSIARLWAARAEGQSGATDFTFQVTRTGTTTGPAGASFSVTGGSLGGTVAALGSDFIGGKYPSGAVSFAAGQTVKQITVQVAGDMAGELNESFNLTLSNPFTGVSLGTVAATGLIWNDDTPGTGTLSIARLQAQRAEGHGGSTPFTFTVTRSGDTTGTASADWVVSGGGAAGTTAAAGIDFSGGVLPTGRVSFAAGQASAVVAVNVAGDTAAELNDSFTVTLAGAQAGVSIGTAAATGVILNDDFVSTAANQTLTGTANADVFLLGGGLDNVTGGGGLDQFLFQLAALGAAAANATTMQDFSRALGEVLNLSAIDAIAGTGANDAFSFIGAAAFNGTPGQLRWEDQGASRLIQGNVNNDTTADLTIFVKTAGPVDGNWFIL